MIPVRRDYQVAALGTAWRELQRKKSVQVVLPSGSGKTRVIADLADKFHRKTGKRVLVVTPMRELVLHAEREITKYTKLSVSVEMAGQCARNSRLASPKNVWVQELAEAGFKPKIVLLEATNVYDLSAEQRWIAQLSSAGSDILNVRRRASSRA